MGKQIIAEEMVTFAYAFCVGAGRRERSRHGEIEAIFTAEATAEAFPATNSSDSVAGDSDATARGACETGVGGESDSRGGGTGWGFGGISSC